VTAQPPPFQRSVSARVLTFAEVPTAAQKVAPTHDTCCSWLCAPPIGGVVIVHVEPSQCSTSTSLLMPRKWSPTGTPTPTAKHEVVLMQDTAAKPLVVPAPGVATVVQLVPSQRFTQGRLFPDGNSVVPAVMQNVPLTHETLPKTFSSLPDGTDVVRSDQVDPFRRAANGRWKPFELYVPTAKQNVLLEQETSLNVAC
jgi:hypothetical protein